MRYILIGGPHAARNWKFEHPTIHDTLNVQRYRQVLGLDIRNTEFVWLHDAGDLLDIHLIKHQVETLQARLRNDSGDGLR